MQGYVTEDKVSTYFNWMFAETAAHAGQVPAASSAPHTCCPATTPPHDAPTPRCGRRKLANLTTGLETSAEKKKDSMCIFSL